MALVDEAGFARCLECRQYEWLIDFMERNDAPHGLIVFVMSQYEIHIAKSLE